MRRVLVALVVLAAACGSSSEKAAPSLCPAGARCATATADLDGDGRSDRFVEYLTDDEVGVAYRLADGTTGHHPFRPDRLLAGAVGIVGAGPLDDLPGDEVVVVESAFAGNTIARMVQWEGGSLADVDDPDSGGHLTFSIGDAPIAGGGFSCDDTDGDGQPELQEYWVRRADDGPWSRQLVEHRWLHGNLQPSEPHQITVVPDAQVARYVGNRCPGFRRLGAKGLRQEG